MPNIEAIAERAHARIDARRERAATAAERYGERRLAELRADPADVIADLDEDAKNEAIWQLVLPAADPHYDAMALERLVADACDALIDREIENGEHLGVAA